MARKSVGEYLADLRQLVEVDIWRINLYRSNRPKYLVLRNVKIVLIAMKGFIQDRVAIKSSALTYFSLLSIVPVLAIAFAIAKGFNLEAYLERQLKELFKSNEAVFETSMDFAERMLDTTSGGLIAGISVVFLLYTVINLLTNIEDIFNDIFEIKKGRSLERKFTDYLSIVIAGPILIILSSSVNIFIVSQIKNLTESFEIINTIKPLIHFLINLIPYVLFWVLFTLLYLVMPNTRVKVGAAMKAAVLAAVIYTITQWGYITFQVGVSRYNAIYGSFAALPLFLIWLQLSWMIVLLGAEFAFALQHVNTWEYDNERLRMSQSLKKRMALMLVYHLVHNFEDGNTAYTADELSKKIQAPLRYVMQVLRELTEVGVVSQVIISGKEDPGYQPGMDTSLLTVQYVINKLIDSGLGNVHLKESAEREKIEQCLSVIDADKIRSRGNMLLKDIRIAQPIEEEEENLVS